MYIPKAFAVHDPEKLSQFIREHAFGILFSTTKQVQIATHLPFVLSGDLRVSGQAYLLGHWAKVNPQWLELNGQEVLVVFSGPHAYISPSWYETPQTVPTWNYAAVHVYGKMELIEDVTDLQQIMIDSLQAFEPNSPLLQEVDETYFVNMLKAVVGFRIHIERIEGKWKLNQNHSRERQEKVIAALKTQVNDPNALQIAALMERNLQDDETVD